MKLKYINYIGSFLGFVFTACGQAPTPSLDATVLNTVGDGPEVVTEEPLVISTPEPSATPTAVAVNAPTVQFNYFDSPGICNALKNWDDTVSTIEFPATAGQWANGYYTFGAEGVTITLNGVTDPLAGNDNTVVITKNGAFNNPPVCIITVTNGRLVSIQ